MNIDQALAAISLLMAVKKNPFIEVYSNRGPNGHVDFHAEISEDSGEICRGIGATLEFCLIDLAENAIAKK